MNGRAWFGRNGKSKTKIIKSYEGQELVESRVCQDSEGIRHIEVTSCATHLVENIKQIAQLFPVAFNQCDP